RRIGIAVGDHVGGATNGDIAAGRDRRRGVGRSGSPEHVLGSVGGLKIAAVAGEIAALVNGAHVDGAERDITACLDIQLGVDGMVALVRDAPGLGAVVGGGVIASRFPEVVVITLAGGAGNHIPDDVEGAGSLQGDIGGHGRGGAI